MNETTKFTSILTIPELDELSEKEARKLFLNYKHKSIITAGKFDDPKWFVTDEYANYTLDFNTEYLADSNFLFVLEISIDNYILSLKTYCLFKFGDLAFASIRGFLAELRHLIGSFDIDKEEFTNDDYIYYNIQQLSEFFSLLCVKNRDMQSALLIAMEDIQDEMRKNKKYGQRELASYDSYFKFNDIINKFWNESDDDNEKLFYFPIYLWWHISAIIPMRPREFVLTPRHCLKQCGDEWKLTIMKDKLKGSNKSISYRIASDYEKRTFTIPKQLANQIKWYIENTSKFSHNELNTLFITDPHYAKWNHCRPFTSRYFTYVNLSTCLRYFYEQIVIEKYNYTVIYDRGSSYLNNHEINYIYLGDTRHLALINLIFEGAAPVVAMQLAGQDSMEISAHYYSNISQYVECKTYRQYRKMLKQTQEFTLSHSNLKPMNVAEFTMFDEGKKCYSEKVSKGDYSDCFKVIGNNGMIGDCTKCIYFIQKGQSFKSKDKQLINELNGQANILKNLVNKYRLDKGDVEDIIAAIMKLKTAEFSYQNYLIEKYKEGSNCQEKK